MSATVPQRPLGSQGLVASTQGLGCMGITAFYGANPAESEEEGLKTIAKALELGINFLDTAWIYQHFESGATNEELVGKALKIHGREKFVVATKFGIVPGAGAINLDSSPERMRSQLNDSLRRLGTDYIDLYYQHRVDPNTPIEQVMETLKQFKEEGKIRYAGLSECTPDELRRAHAVFPVTAIQMEWSLQTRDIEKEIVPTARELGIAIVAYSPLGRGFLTRRFKNADDLAANDFRRNLPRFTGDNLEKNEEGVAKLEALAKKHNATLAQLALGWVHSRGDDVFPIPGTRQVSRLVDNASAVHVKLSAEEWAEVEAAVPEAVGDRYASMGSTFNNRL